MMADSRLIHSWLAASLRVSRVASWLVVVLGVAGHVAIGQPSGPIDDVVVAGNPPLRQSDVATWQRLVEFAFDATLSEEQKRLLGERLAARWQEADDHARAEVLAVKGVWAQVSRAVGPEREVMRLQLRERMLEEAQDDPAEAANQLILELWEAKSPVLVPGDPPLRKGSAKALVSLFEWLTSQALSEEFELAEAERDDILLQLARQYSKASPGDRMLLAHTEELVHWLKLEWDRASAEARSRFRSGLSQLLGLPRPLLPAPFVGEVDTWEHPDGLVKTSFPADWAVRYTVLDEPVTIGGWQLFDVAVLGDVSAGGLELEALPEAGVLLSSGVLPPEVRGGQMTLQEAAFAFGAALLGAHGQAEPLAESVAGEEAALVAWRHRTNDAEYVAWVSALRLPEPEGAGIVLVARAPAVRADECGPAFARVLYGLQLGAGSGLQGEGLSDLLGLPEARDVALDLFSMPLRGQMDLVEGLTSGIK
jgi:hypothetical protein